MDYEKAYKEALELMKGCIPDGNGFVNIRPCDIFPELRESEDERIRKALIKGFNECLISSSHYPENAVKYWHGIVIDDILAWLKKQGDKDKLIEELGEYKAKYIQEVLQKHLEEQKPAWSEEGEKIRKALIDFVQQYGDDFYSQVSKGRAIAWLEKQKIDPRQKYLNALLVADNIYQMAMNDEMVAEAESKAIDALMKLCITKYLLGKHGEQKQDPCEHCNDVMLNCHNFPCIKKKAFEQGKSVSDIINEEGVDNQNCVQSADKIEPKFKVGDWVVSKLDGKARRISEVHCDEYNDYYIVEGDEYQIEEYDRLHHLWSIADAKDGDVLKEGSCIFILRKMKSKNTAITHCCLFDDGDFNLSPTLSFDVDSTFPATKEQRDLLFAKMKEAGYEWDDKKKEPKKIEDELIADVEIPFGAKDSELEEVFYSIPNGFHAEIEDDKVVIKKGEQKPWSEEDERNASYICAALDCYYRLREDRNNTNGQEDLDKARNWLYNKLKFIRPQNSSVTDEELAQAKKDAYNDTLDKIEYHSGEPTFDDGWAAAIWYLKKRNTMPLSHWKPSDEQMDALDSTLQYSQVSHNSFEHLNSLFNDLKKLREK